MSSRAPVRRFTNSGTTNFYYSFVFLPPEKRRGIEAVYAFARRSDDAADNQLPRDEAEQELACCRRDLDWCYEVSAGDGTGISPALAALREAVQRFQIPRQHFDELLRGVEMDFQPARYQTFEDLSLYCYRVASTIGLIAIEIFGYRNAHAQRYAANLGMALQLVNILRDVEADARRGRIYLPQDDLERFGVEPESLGRANPTGNFAELMRFEAQRARGYFAAAREALVPEDRRSMVAAEIMAAIYWRLLKRMEQRKYNIFGHRMRLPKPLKFWIALSVYCGAEWQV